LMLWTGSSTMDTVWTLMLSWCAAVCIRDDHRDILLWARVRAWPWVGCKDLPSCCFPWWLAHFTVAPREWLSLEFYCHCTCMSPWPWRYHTMGNRQWLSNWANVVVGAEDKVAIHICGHFLDQRLLLPTTAS
jgi:hypothetical protein